MTLDQLEIFLAVAQHLHFTRAAEALYITQPSVSAAIQSLEKQYGVELFNRVGRRVELTQAGQLLQSEAQKVLDQVALVERGLRELNDLQRGELNLGASQTIGNYWLPSFISRFKRQYPNIRVQCTLGNTEAIATGTATGLFDLGLVEGLVKPELAACLEQRVIGGDRLQIVVGRTHPWFKRKTIALTDLASTPWVLREPGSGTRQQFEQALHQWGIHFEELTIILEMSSGDMVKAAVEDGVGATALSELVVAKELLLDTLRCLQVKGFAKGAFNPNVMARSFLLLKHQERFQTRIAQTFEQLLD
jgi:DNA-binding transcriptional LysR family regulator